MSLASQLHHSSHVSEDAGDGDRATTFPGTSAKGDGSLYYTGFSGGWAASPNKEGGDKCENCCKDPLKLALIIGILALLVSITAVIMTLSVTNSRIDRMMEYPDTYGITNVNETYSPGISPKIFPNLYIFISHENV